MKNILLFLTILIVGCAKETDVELWQKLLTQERENLSIRQFFSHREF